MSWFVFEKWGKGFWDYRLVKAGLGRELRVNVDERHLRRVCGDLEETLKNDLSKRKTVRGSRVRANRPSNGERRVKGVTG